MGPSRALHDSLVLLRPKIEVGIQGRGLRFVIFSAYEHPFQLLGSFPDQSPDIYTEKMEEIGKPTGVVTHQAASPQLQAHIHLGGLPNRSEFYLVPRPK